MITRETGQILIELAGLTFAWTLIRRSLPRGK